MKRIVSTSTRTLGAALASALLVLALPAPAAAQGVAFQNLAKGEQGPAQATLGRQAFRDAAGLRQAGLEGLLPPGFDFQQAMVLAVVNQGGDAPSIQAVERRILPGGGPPGAAGSQLQLVVTVATQPLPASPLARRPYHLVSIPQQAAQVVFVDAPARRFRTVAQGSQPGAVLPGNYVVRSAQDLSALRIQSLIPVGANIDFSQEMLLAVVSTTKPTGGYSLAIEEVHARAAGFAGAAQEHLEVRVRERAPQGIATAALTQPFHLVALPRSSRVVMFKAALPAPAPVVFYPYTAGSQAPAGLSSGQHALRSTQDLQSAGAQGLIPVGGSFDFSGEMLLAVVMDQKSSGGYATQVTGITRAFDYETETSYLEVSVLETAPSGFATMALTRPYTVVRLPRSIEPVRFVVQTAPGLSPPPATPDPAGTLRARVRVASVMGARAVLLELGGARLLVQPATLAESLRPLEGEEVLVRGRQVGPIALCAQILSPEPLAEPGRLYRDGVGALRFVRSAAATTFPPLAPLAPRGGFLGLLEQPDLHGLELQVEGHVFPDGGLVVTRVKAWAKRDASLYDSTGALSGGVSKHRALDLIGASSDGLVAQPEGVAGLIRLEDLSFTPPNLIGITGSLAPVKKP